MLKVKMTSRKGQIEEVEQLSEDSKESLVNSDSSRESLVSSDSSTESEHPQMSF